MKLKPYESKNLVFFDTEFSSLDPTVGEIMSIGIVKLSGEELYVEIDHNGETSKWVKANLKFDAPKVSKESARRLIKRFLGDLNPFAVAFVDNYDNLYMVKLFGEGKLPFKWLTIDMASILFANGINPKSFMANESGAKAFYKTLGVDLGKYTQHNALDDARLLRDVWLKLTTIPK